MNTIKVAGSTFHVSAQGECQAADSEDAGMAVVLTGLCALVSPPGPESGKFENRGRFFAEHLAEVANATVIETDPDPVQAEDPSLVY